MKMNGWKPMSETPHWKDDPNCLVLIEDLDRGCGMELKTALFIHPELANVFPGISEKAGWFGYDFEGYDEIEISDRILYWKPIPKFPGD